MTTPLALSRTSPGRHGAAGHHATVVALMEASMRAHRGKVAFRAEAQRLTYADMNYLSADFAAWLQHALGVRKGARIAVMLPNTLAFPIAFLGIARAGAVQVHLNPTGTQRQLSDQLRDAGADIMIIARSAAPVLAEIIADTGVRSVITVDAGDGAAPYPAPPSAPAPAPLPGAHHRPAVTPFAAALHAGAALQRLAVPLNGEDALLLHYPGGAGVYGQATTVSHRTLVADAAQLRDVLAAAMRPGEDVIVSAIPPSHQFALMVGFITCFSLGAANWLVDQPPAQLRAPAPGPSGHAP